MFVAMPATREPRWTVDYKTRPGIVHMTLTGTLTVDDMRAFLAAHNAAVDAMGGRDYRVFVDIRGLVPLAANATELMEQAKAYSNAHDNFRGSAVLVNSATIGLQHRRTSIGGRVIDTELISDDEKACWKHLETVHRRVTRR